MGVLYADDLCRSAAFRNSSSSVVDITGPYVAARRHMAATCRSRHTHLPGLRGRGLDAVCGAGTQDRNAILDLAAAARARGESFQSGSVTRQAPKTEHHG